jgi:hypothetical protein
MVIFAYPDTLFNMSVEAVGAYVSDFMRHLITDPRYARGPDGKFHHYEEPCNRLEEYINRHVPPYFAEEVTIKVIRHVNTTYEERMINADFKSACEEIAPFILKSVVHRLVNRLDLIRNEDHPTLLDYYKTRNCDLIYQSLSLLHDLKELRLGKTKNRDNVALEVEGFRDTLKDFSCESVLMSDLETLATKCKQIRCLDIRGAVGYPFKVCGYISKFSHLEKLDISQLSHVSDVDLQVVVCCLAGILSLGEESEEEFESVPSCIEGVSVDSGVGSRPTPANREEVLKFFGCKNPTASHISLIAYFRNLTSLVLHDVQALSLRPLKDLKLLKNFTLIKSNFFCVHDFLKAAGSQLKCLNIRHVANVDMKCISRTCSSLECLHLCFPTWNNLSLSFPPFLRVFSLQLFLYERSEVGIILRRFMNLRKLSTGNNLDADSLLFDPIMERNNLVHLEELYLGHDRVITFSGGTAKNHQFCSDGRVRVQHLQMS